MDSPSALKPRVMAALGVRPTEASMAVWVSALFLVTQSAHGLGANAADTLFFLRFGVDELPLMIIYASGVVMLVLLAHTVGLSARGPERWLASVTAASALWAIGEWASVFLDTDVVYPLIWVSTQAVIMLTFTMMWNVAGSVCDTRQAKRLFPLFATAGVVGGVAGNFLTGPLAQLFGAPALFLIQGALFVTSTILLTRVRGFMNEDDQPSTSLRATLTGAIDSIRRRSLLKLAAVVAFLMGGLFYLVVFPFSESVAGSFGSEAEMAGFLGIFSSVATVATFIVGLFVAKWMFSRLGIVLALLTVPIVYVLGFGLWLAEFSLATAAVVRGAQWVAVNAIGGTGYPALFNVITGRRRVELVAFMTAVPTQLGAAAGGATLLAFGAGSTTPRFGLGLLVALGTLVVVLLMRPAYLDSVLTSVRQGLVGIFDVPGGGLISPIDGDASRVLESRLSSSSPQARAYALSALVRLGGPDSRDAILPFLSDESARVRAAAFDAICDLDPDRFSDQAFVALTDDDPDIRSRALHYAASFNDRGPARRALIDPDPDVRAVAAAIAGGEAGFETATELVAAGNPASLRSLLAEIVRWKPDFELDVQTLLGHDQPEIRALAARAHGVMGGELEALTPLLNDRSLRVRREAANVLAESDRGRGVLIDTIQRGSVEETDAALRALTPLSRFEDDFLVWAGNEAARAAKLNRLSRAVAGGPDSDALRLLRRTLTRRATRLEQWVLMAMTTVDTQAVMPLVERGVAVDDAETKAQALEALEAVGDRGVLGVLLPLLEQADDESKGATPFDALAELSSDFDSWLRALASRSALDREEPDGEAARTDPTRSGVPNFGDVAVDKLDALSLVDRVLAMQRVEMFSGLDPEELEVLAARTTEVAYEPGALIFEQGEEGDEALMIVEGSVTVTVTDGAETRVVNAYGPGDSVGELALLRTGVRSADVVADAEGVHGLLMTKSDFLMAIEERPSVALGMLSTLAERLVEET